MSGAPNAQKFDKWERWIEDVRWAAVLLMDRRRWNATFEAIVNANPQLHPGIPVLDYFRFTYKDYAILAIRRLVRRGPDSITLTGLLDDLRDEHRTLTRDWHRMLYGRPTPNGTIYPEEMANFLADSAFARFIEHGESFVSSRIVSTDLAALEAATSRLVHHSDRQIAHNDRRGDGPQFSPLTYAELDAAIVAVAETAKKYVLLLTGAAMVSMTPIDLTDSIDVFRFPWIDPDHPPHLPDA